MVGGSPSMAKRRGLAANPDHPGPEHAQKTSPPCMGNSDMSIKVHSTVSSQPQTCMGPTHLSPQPYSYE